MRIMIVVLIFTTLLYSSTQAYDCDIAINTCGLTDYFTPGRGYKCIPDPYSTDVRCTCPGNAYEYNKPCRLCNRTDPRDNVCNVNHPDYFRCAEYDTYKTAYACLCKNPSGGISPTLDANCDLKHTLTESTSTTALSCKPGPLSSCLNGADYVSGKCQCPSGYAGPTCQQKIDPNVCQRINCANNGVAAIRNPNGPYECVCLCRSGTWGEYCELKGTSGFCGPTSCLNSGVCKENLIASTRFAYCACQPGYNGTKCDTKYFTCKSVGFFPDDAMKDQGKYFECKAVGSLYQATRLSCPKGLTFDTTSKCCIE